MWRKKYYPPRTLFSYYSLYIFIHQKHPLIFWYHLWTNDRKLAIILIIIKIIIIKMHFLFFFLRFDKTRGGKLNARYASNNPLLLGKKRVFDGQNVVVDVAFNPGPRGDEISRATTQFRRPGGDKNDGEATGASKNRGRAPTTQFQACQRSCGEREARENGGGRLGWNALTHPSY